MARRQLSDIVVRLRSLEEDEVAIAMRLTFPNTLPEPNSNAHAMAVQDAGEKWPPQKTWEQEQMDEVAKDDEAIAALIADADEDVLEERDAIENLFSWKLQRRPYPINNYNVALDHQLQTSRRSRRKSAVTTVERSAISQIIIL